MVWGRLRPEQPGSGSWVAAHSRRHGGGGRHVCTRSCTPRCPPPPPPRPPLWAGPGLRGRGRKGSVWRRTQQPRAPRPSAHSRKPRLSTGTVDRRPVCGRRRGLRIIPSGMAMATASPHRLLASTCCSQPAAATVFPVLWTRPWLHGGRETELCRHHELSPRRLVKVDPSAVFPKPRQPPFSFRPYHFAGFRIPHECINKVCEL